MKSLVLTLMVLVPTLVVAQYDSYDKDMIATANSYVIKPTGTIYEFKGGETVSFKYWENNNKVTGELTVKGVVCQVYGIYEGEGSYFGSVWHNGESKGVITWDFSTDCTTIINKIDSKTFSINVCREYN